MSVLLIHGENEFGANEFYMAALKDFVAANSKQTLQVFDGQNAAVDTVEESLSAQSLFSTGDQMIAIKRFGKNNELRDRLADLIKTIPSETQLIIYEPKIDKRSKLYKIIKKHSSTKEFNNLSEPELIKWMIERAGEKMANFAPGSAKLLIEMTKGNQLKIASELDKLVGYDKTITRESVKLLVDRAPDDNIFDLLDFVARDDKKGALKKYEELSEAQVDAHYILVMLCWQVANFLAVKSGNKKSDREIASELGMNPYAISKTRQIVKQFSFSRIKQMALLTLEYDIELKTKSVDPDQLVRQLIVKL